MLWRIFRVFKASDEEIGAIQRTSAEKAKAEQLKKESRASKALSSKGFLVNLGITLVFTILFVWLLATISPEKDINSFDPWRILGIDRSANLSTIKRAYRVLSKQWHPDRCRDGPNCEATFILIKKAHDILTDEKAYKNLLATSFSLEFY